MASAKTKKKKTSKKVAAIRNTVIIVIVLCIAAYFINLSGIVPLLMNGVTIYTTPAGGTKTVKEKVSVTELQYKYVETFNMYTFYGIIDKDNPKLDEKSTSNAKYTNYEFLMDNAASSLETNILYNDAAKAAGYESKSNAKRAAEINLENLKESASQSNYNNVTMYLQGAYGNGMSVRKFKECVERETLAEEYQNYVKQFECTPSQEEIQSTFDKSPRSFDVVNCNYYLIPYTSDEGKDPTDENKAAVKKAAQAVIDKATDSKSFRDETLAQLTELKLDGAVAAFNNDADPTIHEKLKTENANFSSTEVNAFFFGGTAKAGDKKIVETTDGVYALLFNSIGPDTEKNASFRKITLGNKLAEDENEKAEKIKAEAEKIRATADSLAQNAGDEENFIKLVKDNSTELTEITSGGFDEAVKESDYKDAGNSAEDADEETKIDDANEKALGEWLFSADRKKGDTLVQTAGDNSEVVIYYFDTVREGWQQEIFEKLRDEKYSEWSKKITEGNTLSHQVHFKTMKYLNRTFGNDKY